MTSVDRCLWIVSYLVTAGMIPLMLIAYLMGPARRRVNRTNELVNRIDKSENLRKQEAAYDLLLRSARNMAALSDDRYNWRSYVLPLCFISTILFVGFFLIFTAGEPLYKLQTLDELILNIPTSVFHGFAAGCFFALFSLVGRYHTADITPTLITQLGSHVLLAGALALFATTLTTDSLDPGVAFAAGFIPYKDLTEWLRRKAKEKIGASETKDNLPDEIRQRKVSDDLSAIGGMAVEHRERLAEEGILTVGNLAMANPFSLYLSTPYEMQQIIGWIDQAILFQFASVAHAEQLSAIGIRGVLEMRSLPLVDGPETEEEINSVIESRLNVLARAMGMDNQYLPGIRYLVWQVNNDPQVQLLQRMWEEFGGT